MCNPTFFINVTALGAGLNKALGTEDDKGKSE